MLFPSTCPSRENKKSVSRIARAIIPRVVTFDFFSRYIFLEYTLDMQGGGKVRRGLAGGIGGCGEGVGIREFICVLPAG